MWRERRVVREVDLNGSEHGAPPRPSLSVIEVIAGWLLGAVGLVKGIHSLSAYGHGGVLLAAVIWISFCLLVTLGLLAWRLLDGFGRGVVRFAAHVSGVGLLLALTVAAEGAGDVFFPADVWWSGIPVGAADNDIKRLRRAKVMAGEVVLPGLALTSCLAVLLGAWVETTGLPDVVVILAMVATAMVGFLATLLVLRLVMHHQAD